MNNAALVRCKVIPAWFYHLIVKTCLNFFSVVSGRLTAHNLSSAKGWHLKTCNDHLHFYFSHNTQQVSQEKIKKLSWSFMRDEALGNGIYWFQVCA
jgi:hypothetical protein